MATAIPNASSQNALIAKTASAAPWSPEPIHCSKHNHWGKLDRWARSGKHLNRPYWKCWACPTETGGWLGWAAPPTDSDNHAAPNVHSSPNPKGKPTTTTTIPSSPSTDLSSTLSRSTVVNSPVQRVGPPASPTAGTSLAQNQIGKLINVVMALSKKIDEQDKLILTIDGNMGSLEDSVKHLGYKQDDAILMIKKMRQQLLEAVGSPKEGVAPLNDFIDDEAVPCEDDVWSEAYSILDKEEEKRKSNKQKNKKSKKREGEQQQQQKNKKPRKPRAPKAKKPTPDEILEKVNKEISIREATETVSPGKKEEESKEDSFKRLSKLSGEPIEASKDMMVIEDSSLFDAEDDETADWLGI